MKVYQAAVSWDDRWFQLDGFYRTGHLHWQYEGDFFGLYRDAYYGENIDIYNGEAPVGFEIAGKKRLSGLKVAFGPQLWWGANPAVFVKYQRPLGGIAWTGIFQEDFAQQTPLTSSVAIPLPPTRKASLSDADPRRALRLRGRRPLVGPAAGGRDLPAGGRGPGDAGEPTAPEDIRRTRSRTRTPSASRPS